MASETVGHGLKHLIVDVVHHIKRVVPLRFFHVSNLMSKQQKIHKVTTESIVVSTTWVYVLPEDPHKQVIEREKTRIITNNTLRSIELNQPVLVSPCRAMKTNPRRNRDTLEVIPKKLGKLKEGGLTIHIS